MFKNFLKNCKNKLRLTHDEIEKLLELEDYHTEDENDIDEIRDILDLNEDDGCNVSNQGNYDQLAEMELLPEDEIGLQNTDTGAATSSSAVGETASRPVGSSSSEFPAQGPSTGNFSVPDPLEYGNDADDTRIFGFGGGLGYDIW